MRNHDDTPRAVVLGVLAIFAIFGALIGCNDQPAYNRNRRFCRPGMFSLIPMNQESAVGNSVPAAVSSTCSVQAPSASGVGSIRP